MIKKPLNILLVVGSSRTKRIGGKIAHHVASNIRQRGHQLSILDPRDPIHDDFFMRLMEKAYFHYKEDDTIPLPLISAAKKIQDADAYVVVTPEYNHTISPALTNTMNYFGSSMYGQKASGICTYSAGLWGGARCGVALRSYLSELGCLPVSATCQVTSAWKPGTFEEETGMLQEQHMGTKLCNRMLDQLEWNAHALRDAREKEKAEAV
jgi:chromate reductase, NAD(P)H dehydrogenase (quinone)